MHVGRQERKKGKNVDMDSVYILSISAVALLAGGVAYYLNKRTSSSSSIPDDKGGGFDYIVVGAGTSGCTVAARLAQSTSKPSVLLVEAGNDNSRSLLVSGKQRIIVCIM